MNGLNRKRTQILLIIGLITLALSQILTHYMELSDLGNGAFTGVGIGMVLVALGKSKIKGAKAH